MDFGKHWDAEEKTPINFKSPTNYNLAVECASL